MAKKESKTTNKKEKNIKNKTSYFKSFKGELKKVSWPTPKQLINNTVAVVVIVIILSAIVFVLDLTFEAVNKYGIDKIKQSVVGTSEEKNNNETENNTVNNDNMETEATTENVTETENASTEQSNTTTIENNQ